MSRAWAVEVSAYQHVLCTGWKRGELAIFKVGRIGNERRPVCFEKRFGGGAEVTEIVDDGFDALIGEDLRVLAEGSCRALGD